MSKVTVLVAAYNACKYLAECLDSLAGQTLKDIQIVCIDDASTDSTLDIINEYAAADSRFVVLHLSANSGQAVARNKGIQVADGDYITMVDADDRLSADALEQAVSVLDSDKETGSVLFNLVKRRLNLVWTGQFTAYTCRARNCSGVFRMMTHAGFSAMTTQPDCII